MRAPRDPEAMRLAQAAMQAFGRRDFAMAQQLARQLLLRNPLDANANQLLGAIALESGDASGAKTYLERAEKAAPNQPQILNTLGVASRRAGDAAAARRAFTRAGELGLIDGWRNLGMLENLEQNADASMAAYQRALRIAARDPAAHAALAEAYERKHDLGRAKSHAMIALDGDPANEIASIALAHVLMRERDYAGAEAAALAATRGTSGSKINQSVAWGIVGDARDKSGDAPAAFEAFTAANRILRQEHAALLNASHLLYHPDGLKHMTALVAQTDLAAWRAPSATFETPAPVFLIGFPRSGTTLLDQILSSHSRIVCIEEREHFANALGAVISDRVKLAAFASLDDGEIEGIRGDYWARVKAEAALPAGALVVDKLPLNIVVTPLIKRVFPDAKIIFALRDPRDVILSCYQQRFGMNAAMAQFLELGSAARYYDLVMQLMQLSREKLALDLHQVRYEDVVGDLEAAARALAGFLGLDYEPAMLAFSETAKSRVINTPSARQVIEPLYARSVGRWRRYAGELAPAMPILAPWVDRFGYQP